MKIALIGATGFIGQYILREAIARKHQVTALVRDASKVAKVEGVSAQALEVHNSNALIKTLAGHDIAILSFHYVDIDLHALLNSVKASGVPRLLVVGGAASLEVAPGVKLIESPDFPAEWKGPALAAAEFLTLLRSEKVLNWTYLSPSAVIESGERTATFRLGKEQLLVNEQGESRISNQDFAVALIDELETPQHSQARFTVGY